MTRSTAQSGNPNEATRGAAYDRAKLALGESLNFLISYDLEAMEFARLAPVIGCTIGEVAARLERATLGEITTWTAALEAVISTRLLTPISETTQPELVPAKRRFALPVPKKVIT